MKSVIYTGMDEEQEYVLAGSAWLIETPLLVVVVTGYEVAQRSF